MSDREILEALREEYEALVHAMQSAVRFKMGIDANDTSPKHLRVGINAAMADQGGLATLLIEKGIITEVEYFRAMRDAMRRELESYQQWFKERGLPYNFA